MRKAAPAKSPAKAAKPSAQKPSKQTQKAKTATKAAVKAQPKAAPKPVAPAKKPGGAKAQPKKGVPAPAQKARPTKGAGQPAKPAPRPAHQPKRQPTRDEAAALKAFERAHKEFTRGSFSTARELFRALIQQHGGVSEVTARARIYLNIAESRLHTEAALPRDPDLLYERGVYELNRGDFVAAQEMFERALKRDPSAADTHYALAATRARLGAVASALQSLEKAIELRAVLRVRAQSDADLAPLRSDPEFERIVYGPHRP
ncbi:MAG TPA: tetratricopeptide repeat protein [Pyrinomonadaceae bacterium]|nr:tetratricopeptide repeat protein [Pyrinomonadaceae bacterium]